MNLPNHYIKANNTPLGEGGDDLAEFRNQWKKELTVKTGDSLQDAANRDDGHDQDDDVHRKVSVKAKLDLCRNGLNGILAV